MPLQNILSYIFVQEGGGEKIHWVCFSSSFHDKIIECKKNHIYV